MVSRIKKRDGAIVKFNGLKIENAVKRAFWATNTQDYGKVKEITKIIINILDKKFMDIASVEQVQDTVEEVLLNKNYFKIARAYMLYREEHRKLRELKLYPEVKEEPILSINALKVLQRRYLLRDNSGNIIETPKQLFLRVAKNIALADKKYRQDHKKSEREFFNLMVNLDFLPNSPTLMNAGTKIQQLSACYVLPINDSLDSIFTTLKNSAMVMQSGGGIGYNFSNLRPEGAIISSTKGISSGPLSFMRIFDIATEVMKSGGKRRGALMGILDIEHPDILKFISAKRRENFLANFNISVAVTDKFMDTMEKERNYSLKNGVKLNAKAVFDLIVRNAWLTGDPGVIFIDEINNKHKLKEKIEATNPCVVGETFVAVADGRNYVSIKQLAEEGRDIPVYCYGDSCIQIRMGRNPRKTREKAPVWKIVLDDNSYIIATEDHKFRDRNNKEIKLKDLKPGMSLMPFYKFKYQPTGKKSPYWGISLNNGSAHGEHRMIAEFYLGKKIEKYPQEVVHHKNFCGLDNRRENLEILSQNEHDSFHQKGEQNVMKGKWWAKLSEGEKKIYRENMSKAVSGINNPMYGRKHSEETRKVISTKSKERLKDPTFRKMLSDKIKLLYKTTDLAQKVSKAKTKYNYLTINCLTCNKEIIIKENNIKKFCSRSCQAIFMNKIRDTSQVRLTKARKREELREKLYKIGLEFIEKNDYLPKYFEFKEFAKNNFDLSGDLRSTFGDYTAFKERLLLKNHKVVSVEFYGCQDVYNITVDEFHTIAYITNPSALTKISKKPLISGIITSQCGEQPLLNYESCNLGSINLSNMVKDGKIGWEKLRKTIHAAIHFLDNVIDINKYPIKETEEITKKNRKIGLGVMGFADMLIKLGIRYDSLEALDIAEHLMKFIKQESLKKSIELANKRGSFPNFKKSKLSKHYKSMRNLTLLTIAPTGTISIIAGCSSGIEPLFAVAFTREVMDRTNLVEINREFERIAKELKYPKKTIDKVIRNGSLSNIKEINQNIKNIFRTALDIAPDWHVKMQAVFQKYVDNAVSKTINLSKDATIEDVKKAYLLAYKLKCKGITVYRYGSKKEQVLYIKPNKEIIAHSEYSGGCPDNKCIF